MKLAFVGYGSIAASHARSLRDAPGVEVTWVVGRDPATTEAFAREWEIPHWTLDLDAALASDVDGVIITSPSDLHAAQTLACLRAGKHVLPEIPLATSLADAEAVAEAARGGALRVQVAHTQRYYPGLVELRRRVEAGKLRPHHLVFRWFFLRRENVNWKGRRRTWTDNLLWHHGGHVVDAALWVLGQEPDLESVRAQFGPPHPELGIPLDLDVQFRAGGVLVNVAMSYNSPWPRHEYLVIGEEGCLEYRDGKLWGPEGLVHDPAPADAILDQDLEWFAAIREGRSPAASPDAVLPAMRVLGAAQAQLAAGA